MRRKSLVCMVFFMVLTAVVRAVPVERIEVRHSKNIPIDAESVMAYVGIKQGDEFSAREIAKDVKALKETRRYSYVSAEVQRLPGGVIVTYVVNPKLRVTSLRIDGGDFISNRRIKNYMELEVGDLVDENELEVKLQKVRDEYTKRYFPFVTVRYEMEKNAERGTTDVQITVVEGDRSKVKKIEFRGNRAISSYKLRKVMEQKKVNIWTSWLSGTGTYNRDDLERDLLTIRDVYRAAGYLDVEVQQPVVEENGRAIEIIIPIVEHDLYRVGRIQIDGNTRFAAATLLQQVNLKPGDLAATLATDKARQAIRDYYGSRGYIRTDVRMKLVGMEDNMADLYFTIREGKLARIRNIDIRGNTRTKDEVIRRELSVLPGDVYDEVRVRTSAARLRNLGYFSFVNPVSEETPKLDEYDLVMNLQEQKTGQFSAGAGFSSVDDVIGFLELSQGNFDLFNPPAFMGDGQKLKARLQLGTSRNDISVDYAEPWFLDRKLRLGVSGFRSDKRFLSDDYDQRNTGGQISLGKSLGTYWRGSVAYDLEEFDIFDVSSNASEVIQAEEGAQTQSAGILTFLRDTRDHSFIPTRGNQTRMRGKLAGGPLGFDTDLYMVEVRSSHFIPLWYDHVLNIKGWLRSVEEYGDSDRVPIFDRLFLGGARTIRGFDFRDVGPKDDRGQPIGGKSDWWSTIEYTAPFAPRLRAATFFDIGQVYEDAYGWDIGDHNSSYGIGMRIDMPQFPLRLDYSWPLKADEYNDRSSGRFSFLIGHTF